jgi:benzoate/toluate 1,2-dioxygenase alpha subunit
LDLNALIDDRPADGAFRVSRRVFTDPEVFELEMRYIFEGGWVFLGLESQVPKPHDFLTTTIGRKPVVVMRDQDGLLRCFLNSCRHKGALICRLGQGNRKLHVCPYHSWSYDSAGKNRAIKNREKGAYAPAFDADGHDLAPVAKFENYRGLLFASLNPDVPTLKEYLGEARTLLDIAIDQGPDGLELVPGAVHFTYEGNWKLQLENCSDAYHFTSAHTSYLRLLDQRHAQKPKTKERSVWDEDRPWQEGGKAGNGITSGTFSFDNGHVLNWNIMGVSPTLPLFERAQELAAKFGEARRNWMFNMRNLTIFPNLQIAENASSQLRVIRPIAPDRTEMLTWCVAPIGESAAARRQRIRQYEDFFNPSGLATPDDTTAYEDCQSGARAPSGWLQGYARGMTATRSGANSLTAPIGMTPAAGVLAGPELCDETVFHAYYRAWRALIAKGLERERGTAA